jgi:hypothetical protein
MILMVHNSRVIPMSIGISSKIIIRLDCAIHRDLSLSINKCLSYAGDCRETQTDLYLFQVNTQSLLLLMSVNCWPSPLGDGTTDVNIEYETESNTSMLEGVIITIPFPVYESSYGCLLNYRSGSIPEVREVDGDYQITAAGFEWRPSISEVENGRLEFNIEGDDVEGFYPVEVRYKTATPVCTIDVSPLSHSADSNRLQMSNLWICSRVCHIQFPSRQSL